MFGTGATPPTLTIHGPGWTPTVIPVRTQGNLTILGLTIDLATHQISQLQSTHAQLTQAATILGAQHVADTSALVASVSTTAKAAYTAQFVPWTLQELIALDVPLNRAFRRLLKLPPAHPNALLYMSAKNGGLGLPRLSDQVNTRKWAMANRLQQRGGLPALAVSGLLTRASELSGGQFLLPNLGDFIGPHPSTPVWGNSLGAIGQDTALRLAPTLGPVHHPLRRPLTLGLPRLDNYPLLRTLHRLGLHTCADLTTRAPDGTRSWLDLPALLPDLSLPSFLPAHPPWPGDPVSARPGQFWRLMRGSGDWEWGGIHQVLTFLPEQNALILQRWVDLHTTPGGQRSISRADHTFTTSITDFSTRCSHRLIVLLTRNNMKGTIRAEFPDTRNLTESSFNTWVDSLRPFLTSAPSWSIYTDSSWRAITPPPSPSSVRIARVPQWSRGPVSLCFDIRAVRFDIPPTLPALGGTAQVAELLAINAGLQLLHSLNLSGTVYSDCLGAVKKITRRWSTGRSFLDAGAALVTSCRTFLSERIHLKWLKGHPERSDIPPTAWSKQQWGICLADALAKNRDISSLPFSPVPILHTHSIPLHDILTTTSPPGTWQLLSPEGTPPLGSFHAMLSHQRVLAYRVNRDLIRATRGAPPIWVDSHQSVGASSWFPRPQPLRKRVQALRTLWDLRWHSENKAVATHSLDPQVSACPICRRHWTQAHVLWECPSTTGARMAGSLDLTLAVSRLPPGGAEVSAPPLYLQPAYSYGTPLGGTMGSRSHSLPSTRHRALH